MSVLATNSMRFGAIIVFFGIMAVLNVMSSTRCTQLMKEKGEMERELARLEDAYMRESTRWEEMTTPDKVEDVLALRGIPMRPPRPEQNVMMMSDGRPRPGQLVFAKMKSREQVRTASVSPSLRSAPSARSVYRRKRDR